MIRCLFLLTLSFSAGAFGTDPKTPKPILAIIGDSISSGAFSHPQQKWNLKEVGSLLTTFGPTLDLKAYAEDFRSVVPFKGRIQAPTRVWETLAHPVGGILDTEEHSWGYLLGRSQGVAPKDILITAEKGNHVGDAEKQAQRLLKSTRNTVPDQTFFFFTGNNLCGKDPQENFDFEGAKNEFRDSLVKGANQFISAASAEGKTSKVYLMKFLPVMNLIKNKGIREKVVEAYGMKLTCERMRELPSDQIPPPDKNDGVAQGALSLLQTLKNFGALNVPEKELKSIPSITAVCTGILKTTSNDEARIVFFERLIQAYNQGVEEAVRVANGNARDSKKQIDFTLLSSPGNFEAEAEDIGQDCFHLSLQGQEKLTRLVMKELKERQEKGPDPVPGPDSESHR